MPKAEDPQAMPWRGNLAGPDHAVTLNVVSTRRRATPTGYAGEDRRIRHYRRALEGVRKKFGDKHMNTIIATHNYANYLPMSAISPS